MNLSKLFFWIKNKKKRASLPPSLPSHTFDQKIVKKIQTTILPHWSQFRYLKNFLSKKEKMLVTVSLFVFFLSLTSWGAIWVIQHQMVVPAHGGEYSEALIGQPKYINPIFASANDVDADIASLVYSGLFTYNNTEQKLTPDLATDYTISPDGKIYDINLRQDVKWSDGEPLTASDVLYTFQTIQDPEIGSPLLPTFQGVDVEQTGDFSVRFTLKEGSFAPFLNSLTVGIVPQHIWINVPPSTIRLAKNNLQPIGSGPWKFSKMTKKDTTGSVESYTLVPNELYYKKVPYISKFIFQFYSDYTEVGIALRSQYVLASSFLPNDLTEKIIGKNFQLNEFKLPQYTALFFNQDSNTNLKNTDFRLALNLAIDKNKIVSEALHNKGIAIQSPILPGYLGYSTSNTFPGFDPEKTNEILSKTWTKIQPEDFYTIEYENALTQKKAFFDEIKNNTSTPAEEREALVQKLEEEIGTTVRQSMNPGQTFFRKNKANEILSLTITTADTPEYQQVAETIANLWRAVGIKTEIEVAPSSEISRGVLRSRSYEILLYGEIVGADPDPYPFWHSSQVSYPGLNLSLFTDRAADKLLEDARTTTTEKIRTENYQKFQDILGKQIPAVFLYVPTYNFVISKNIKGLSLSNIFSPADRFNDANTWYTKTKYQWKK